MRTESNKSKSLAKEACSESARRWEGKGDNKGGKIGETRKGAKRVMTKPIKRQESKKQNVATELAKVWEKLQQQPQKQGNGVSQMMHSPSGPIS